MQQTIGKRIAQIRQAQGWTQQSLSERLAISRVAVSHIEMDLSIPEERTITLLAGIFKIPPHILVNDTTYPQAKVERLPLVACSYTSLERDLALIENDLAWLKMLRDAPDYQRFLEDVRCKWIEQLTTWEAETIDLGEKKLLENAWQQLNTILAERKESSQ